MASAGNQLRIGRCTGQVGFLMRRIEISFPPLLFSFPPFSRMHQVYPLIAVIPYEARLALYKTQLFHLSGAVRSPSGSQVNEAD